MQSPTLSPSLSPTLYPTISPILNDTLPYFPMEGLEEEVGPGEGSEEEKDSLGLLQHEMVTLSHSLGDIIDEANEIEEEVVQVQYVTQEENENVDVGGGGYLYGDLEQEVIVPLSRPDTNDEGSAADHTVTETKREKHHRQHQQAASEGEHKGKHHELKAARAEHRQRVVSSKARMRKTPLDNVTGMMPIVHSEQSESSSLRKKKLDGIAKDETTRQRNGKAARRRRRKL